MAPKARCRLRIRLRRRGLTLHLRQLHRLVPQAKLIRHGTKEDYLEGEDRELEAALGHNPLLSRMNGALSARGLCPLA